MTPPFTDTVESLAHSLLITCMLGRSCAPLHISIDELLVKRRPRQPPVRQGWSAQPTAQRLKICLIPSQIKASRLDAYLDTVVARGSQSAIIIVSLDLYFVGLAPQKNLNQLRPFITFEGVNQAVVFPASSPGRATQKPL